jgi:hypothetical protein
LNYLPTWRSALSAKNGLEAQKGGQMNNLIDIFCDVDDFYGKNQPFR